jgi:8-oxo-dGTP pyrophosphatase MutT (NUDIX family)
MYKVFFKDRTVFFRDDFPETFRTKDGLFYKFESRENLAEIISAFFKLEKINSLYLFHNDLQFLWNEFSAFFKPIKAAGGLVRNSKGEFLVIRRNGIWDLPKGKAEKGETPSETAIREVCEECGINPPELNGSLLKTFHAYKQDGKAILKETDWFNMKVNGKVKTTPQEKENITEIRWLKPDQLKVIKANTFPLILEVMSEAKIF